MTEQASNIMVKLISCDNKEFFVNQRVAFMSELIKNLYSTNPEESKEIRVPDIEGPILMKIIDFCIFIGFLDSL